MAEADQPDLPGNVCAYKLTPHDRNLAGLSHQTHQQFAASQKRSAVLFRHFFGNRAQLIAENPAVSKIASTDKSLVTWFAGLHHAVCDR